MWLPGFERWEIPGRPGVPYDEYDDPKAMWHTTQGTSIEGAVSAYAAYPPQLIVDPVRKRKVQHISLNNAGYALWNEDVDDSRCVQIEVVGYAEDTHLWSDETYRWLGEEVARPLHEHFGVPYVAVWKGFKGEGDVDFVLASSASPLRLTQWEIDHFSGHLAHQHSPGDTHWDAGGFKCELMLAYARGSVAPPEIIRKRGKAMFSMEVTDQPVLPGDPRLAGTTLTGGVPKGFSAIFDPIGPRVIGLANAAGTQKGSKDAFVPHYGVTGGEFLDAVKQYTAPKAS